VILALGKVRSRREPNLGCRGADRSGWCDALPKEKACARAVEWADALMQIRESFYSVTACVKLSLLCWISS